MHSALEARRGRREEVQVRAVVRFGKKACIPIDAPLDNVQGNSGHHPSSLARHAITNGTGITAVDR
jgi:hypothetical protein